MTDTEKQTPLGRLAPLKISTVPVFAGLLAYLGPGLVWTGLAQGSGELIWWPYFTAKYAGWFLAFLIPACLLQYWLNQEIIRYTVTTGETMMTGFGRISAFYVGLICVGVFVENLWFGAYAVSGGTALSELTHFPWYVSQSVDADAYKQAMKGSSMFWGYSMIAIYVIVLLLGRVAYKVVEKLTIAVVGITAVGMALALTQGRVWAAAPEFFSQLVNFHWTPPPNWDPKDAEKLMTAIAFAGAGGFGQFFLGYWIRDKGVGMAKYIGRVTSPISGQEEAIPSTGYAFEDTEHNQRNYAGFLRYMKVENGIGITLNMATTIIMCWLAWTFLLPTGRLPTGYDVAVVQADFLKQALPFGGVLFLIVGAAFLCDAWLQLTDGLSRVQADYFYANTPLGKRFSFRTLYWFFVAFFTLATCITIPLGEPGELIAVRGMMSFAAMALFAPGLIYLNFVLLPKAFPSWVRPPVWTQVMMWLVTLIYVGLMLVYLKVKFLPQVWFFGL